MPENKHLDVETAYRVLLAHVRPRGYDALQMVDAWEAAKAIVAACRPIIAAKTLREAARYLYEHRRDEGASWDLWQMYEAGGPEWLVSRAQAAEMEVDREESRNG